MYDTYGEEFGDLIADIPDPTATPLRLITDFQHVLDQLGKSFYIYYNVLCDFIFFVFSFSKMQFDKILQSFSPCLP